MTGDLRTARELNILWGVHSVYVPELATLDAKMEERNIVAIKRAHAMGLVTNVCFFFLFFFLRVVFSFFFFVVLFAPTKL